jgi:hypothetical protein
MDAIVRGVVGAECFAKERIVVRFRCRTRGERNDRLNEKLTVCTVVLRVLHQVLKDKL